MTEQSATANTHQQQGQPPQPQPRLRQTLMAATIALVGGALTVGALVLVSSNTSTGEASSNLSTVAAADIAAATQTIDPAVSTQLAAAAKNCSVPLAHVTIVKSATASGGRIRIKSGNYVSPVFQVTDVPQRVAIPFPGSYPLGRGVITIEGDASGTVISLYPAWKIETLNGSAVRNVVWKPGNPCQ